MAERTGIIPDGDPQFSFGDGRGFALTPEQHKLEDHTGLPGVGGGGGGVSPVIDKFTPADLQTVFNLSQEPADPATVIFVVNGVNYPPDPNTFVISGGTNQVLTWQDVIATILSTDLVYAYYFV
jgi:hypothetical protein